MPTLTVEQNGERITGTVSGRVLVGRWPGNTITIEDAGVSRLHAWLDQCEHGYYVADTGSRSGTRVNGYKIRGRYLLRDGDWIRVGLTTLVFRAGEPEGMRPLIEVLPPSSFPKGVLFDCVCGAPIWVPSDFAGGSGTCRYCRHRIHIPEAAHFGLELVELEPEEAGGVATMTVPGTATDVKCSICQWAIGEREETHVCPSCGLKFHAECWKENYGCSSYGCEQVNVLHPDHEHAAAAARPEHAELEEEHDEFEAAGLVPAESHLPWEFVLLAASVIGSLAAVLTFGLPSLVVAACSVTFLQRRRPQGRTGIIVLSTVLALAGIVIGLPISYYWWFGTRR